MYCISMKTCIKYIKSDISHLFITKNSCIGHPLKPTSYRIFYLIQVLDSFRSINYYIRSQRVWTIIPNSLCISLVPIKFVNKHSGSNFLFLFWSNFTIFNCQTQLILKRKSLTPNPIMLIWRLSQTISIRFFSHSFLIGNNRLRNINLNLGKDFPQILQADFYMKLTRASNNMLLSSFILSDLNQRI